MAEGAPAHWRPARTGDQELEAARTSLPGIGELRSQGYTYRKQPAPFAARRQPLPDNLCYCQEIPGYEPPEFREGSPEWLRYWVHHLQKRCQIPRRHIQYIHPASFVAQPEAGHASLPARVPD